MAPAVAALVPVGVVLTGGASSRMGTDKALLEIDGVAMARLVADALAGGGCARVWCQGGDADRLAAAGLDTVADRAPGAGPLDAIGAALAVAAPADAVVVACDLPRLTPEVVRAILSVAASHPEADVVVAADGGGPHLLALWRQRAAGRLADLLVDGVRSYRGALERLAVVRVEVPAGVLLNVNQPGDVPPGR